MGTVNFGAVYFRKTAPPKAEWERDYRQAAEDGQTMFRHWFCWNSIEVADGVFDWEDFDKQLELGLQYGIKTVIAEMSIDTPEWLNSRLYGKGSICGRDQRPRVSQMHTSSATGGHYCLCYDHPEVEFYTNRFLKELALRYRGHPGVIGYDVFNECTLYSPDRLCFCESTNRKFVQWLQKKYQNLKQLCSAWGRYSISDWSQVQLPREWGPYAECADAIAFWNENTFSNMQKKAQVLRTWDPNHKIIAHGNARSYNDIATCCGDDFRAAGLCDIFGYTYYHGTACSPFLAGDLIRSAANGKEFWRAEAVGNSDYQGRSPELPPQIQKDRASNPDYLRMDALTSIACGARAYLTPRWRPLLSGPLAGSFGWYGLDGSPTPRSEEMRKLAQWCRKNDALWQAFPQKAEAAILIVPESQVFSYLFGQYGRYDSFYNHMYSQCIQGIYQAFCESHIPCDFVQMENIDSYRLLYLAYPLSLSDTQIARLTDWVKKGGVLIAEAGFGYFTPSMRARISMKCSGILSLLGCVPEELLMTPDRLSNLQIQAAQGQIPGGIYQQSFATPEGEVLARYSDGKAACVRHFYGAGSVVSIGTMFSFGYCAAPQKSTRLFLQQRCREAGLSLPFFVSDSRLVVKLWRSEEKTFLWILNPASERVRAEVKVFGEPLRAICLEELRPAGVLGDDGVEMEPMEAMVLAIRHPKSIHEDINVREWSVTK